MHNHHHPLAQPPSISPLPLYHGSPAPDRCPASADRPFPERISPGCGCNLHHLHASSGSPHFLRTMETAHACCQPGTSELRRPSSAEESRSVFRDPCRSSELSRKFSVAECLFPSHNLSENAYVPRTPQINDFGATPVMQYEPTSTAQFFSWAYKQNNFGMVSEPGHCMMRQQNQVKLYGWYLINSSNNTAEVAVGGSLTPGAVSNGRKETTTITKRLEKCRLLTKDGVEVRLMGLIDDSTTISNGFSVEIVHLFLSGFPYTWERLLENEFRMYKTKITAGPGPGPSQVLENVNLRDSEISKLSAEHVENSRKNASSLNGNQVDKFILDGQTMDVTQCKQNSSETMPDVKLQSIAGDEQGRVNVGDIGMPMNIMEKTQFTEESHEIIHSAQATKDKPDGMPFVQDDTSGLQKETEKLKELDSPVLRMEHMRKSIDSLEKTDQMMRASRRITRSMQRSSKHMGATENETINGVDKFPQLSVSQEPEIENLTKELRGINASSESITDTFLKQRGIHSMRSTRKPVKDNRCRSSTKESSADDPINIKCSDNKEMEEVVIVDDIEVEETALESKQEAESLTETIEKNCSQRIEEEGEIESQNTNGVGTFPQLGVSHESEAESLTKEQNGITTSPESTTDTSLKATDVHLMRSIRKPVKINRHQSCTKESSVDDPINIKCSDNKGMEEKLVTVDDIEVEQTAVESKQNAENLARTIAKTCSQRIEERAVQDPRNVESFARHDADMEEKTESASIESLLSDVGAMNTTIGNEFREGKETHTSCRAGMIPPPLPCPRVPVSKRLISTAFGLKTSRSGRLLVPPLAHWCSQSLIRDKDGGIIAISDCSMNTSALDDGSLKFKPPAGANLQKLQKRLREAAVEGLKTKTTNKKKKST